MGQVVSAEGIDSKCSRLRPTLQTCCLTYWVSPTLSDVLVSFSSTHLPINPCPFPFPSFTHTPCPLPPIFLLWFYILLLLSSLSDIPCLLSFFSLCHFSTHLPINTPRLYPPMICQALSSLFQLSTNQSEERFRSEIVSVHSLQDAACPFSLEKLSVPLS